MLVENLGSYCVTRTKVKFLQLLAHILRLINSWVQNAVDITVFIFWAIGVNHQNDDSRSQ